MIPLAAAVARRWCRGTLTGPLRLIDVLHLIRVGEYQLCVIRPRRSPK